MRRALQASRAPAPMPPDGVVAWGMAHGLTRVASLPSPLLRRVWKRLTPLVRYPRQCGGGLWRVHAPGASYRRGWSEATSRVLPYGLQPGTHLVAQCGNDEAVLKVIPAGEAGKRYGGSRGLEPRDRLGSALDGHPPVGLAVHDKEWQVPQGVELDLPGRARDGNRRHKV